MSALRWPDKDPDERLDYVLRWDAEMDAVGDEIIHSLWFIVDDDETLVIESDGVRNHETYVWLTHGEAGRSYQLTNRITTAAGRIYDRSVLLVILEK